MSGSSQYFVSVVVPRPLDNEYSYLIAEDQQQSIKKGAWVEVPFGKKKLHAYVVSDPQPVTELSDDVPLSKLKKIIRVGSTQIPKDVWDLALWAHRYYHAPWGEVLNTAVSAAALGLRSAKQEARGMDLKPKALGKDSGYTLTEEQSAAAGKIIDGVDTSVTLLKGVTGSGKTEVYIEIAKEILSQGKSVLFLVPEIALTPQLHHRIESRLGLPVGLWHSAVSDGRRRDQWAAMRKGEMKVLVGARSAVFAPLKSLGLIVVDEEHDGSFKQEERFRYHARDLAIVRGQLNRCRVVLGSATPVIETLEKVRQEKFQFAELKNRFGGSQLPTVEFVDLSEEERVDDIQTVLAKKTIQEIQETVDRGEQVMVYLNKRGFASFLLCGDCGEVKECPNCSISMTVYKRRKEIRCHVCGHFEAIPFNCHSCQGTDLLPMGGGTESLEEELGKLVEGLKPVRLDRDQVTSATRLEKVLNDFRDKKYNALLGTQMLVKGHDFPDVTLVVVVLADSLFRWPDFRAPERAYQILTQVSGRAGRGERAGKVLIQTFQPEHPTLQVVSRQLPESDFLENEREMRKVLNYPPFGRLVHLRFEHTQKNEAKKRAETIAIQLQRCAGNQVDVLGPSEALLERAKNAYRFDLLLRSTRVEALQSLISEAKKLSHRHQWPLLVDVDPIGLA